MARYVVSNCTCFVSGEKSVVRLSKLGIVSGCICELYRVIDWRACFQVARNGPGDHVHLRYVCRQ